MLTGRGATADKVNALQSGADDYLTKPFDLEELNARVRAILRRPREMVADVLQWGDVIYDQKSQQVTRGGQRVSLLPKELLMLEFFMRHPGQTFTVNDLLNRIWSSESDSSEQAVRQCMARLRKKLDFDGCPPFIVTVKGLGYKVMDLDAAQERRY
jgi:DNA-binding response OmpR family regulator